MLTRILGRSVRKSKIAPPPSVARLKTRLGCEMLEAREVPAVLFWDPQPGLGLSASVADNWSVGVQGGIRSLTAPGPADDLYFTPVLTVAEPGEGGPITLVTIGIGDPINPPPISPPPTSPPTNPPTTISPDCIFSSASGSQFKSINLVNDYEGTVTFQHDIAVGGFEMTSGAIDQTGVSQSSALTFTVNAAYSTSGGSFTWTGGVLNSGVNAGVVSIVGITNAAIGDGTDTSYTTGSDLKLSGGTILSASGSIILNNGAGLDIGVLCQFKGMPEQPTIPPPPKRWVDLLKGANPQPGLNTVKGIGQVVIEGKASSIGSTFLPIWVYGGELRVEGNNTDVTEVFTTEPLTGQPLTPAEQANQPSVLVTLEGKLVIEEGRTLKVAGRGVRVFNGILTTKVNDTVTNHLAVINGSLVVDGDAAVVQIATEGRPATGVFVPTLHVDGNIFFTKGIYKPTVHAEGGNLHDRWTCKKFYSAATAKIAPIVVGNAPLGLAWDVIIATEGYGDAARPTASVAADWDIQDGDGTSYGQPNTKSINVRKAI